MQKVISSVLMSRLKGDLFYMDKKTEAQNKLIPVLVVIIIIGAFFLGSFYTKVQVYEKGGAPVAAANNGTTNNAANPPPAAVPDTTPVDIKIGDAPRLGNKDAKVAIVEFTDFQCPFCGQLFRDTFPSIKKDYVDTGKIQYIVHDFPLFQIHPYAEKSAEAAHCAEEQGKFWEYHDKLFTNQTALTIDDLKKYAADLGLNTSTFNSCLDGGKYTARVSSDQKEGEKYGVRGTPASFVGVVKGDIVSQAVQVSGAVPFDQFKTTIDDQLKKS